MRRPARRREPRPGLPLRAVAPNIVTALALCAGLTGVRFAIERRFEPAVTMVLIAAMLDGIDGRIARLLHGESRFGAELDSLSDAISFGVAPALILYLWSLQAAARVGWICALRLARFNAQIDAADQPHKSAGFLTGVPAPAGAGLAMLPIFLWLWTELDVLRSPWIVAPWVAFTALLMVSSVATYSWGSLRLRRTVRFEAIVAIVALGAALISAPWPTLSIVAAAYLATMPFSIAGYARVRRLRASPAPGAAVPPSPSL